MGKQRKKVLCLILALVVFCAVLAYHNSFGIALRTTGMSTKNISYIDTGMDDNGHEYRAVFQSDRDAPVKMVLLTKNPIGIWTVTKETTRQEAETQRCAMGWMRVSRIGGFAVGDLSSTEFEVHAAYGGNDAVKRIEFPTDQLPPNVTVNVFQSGSLYMIHLTSYGAADTLNQVSPFDLLEQTGCIQQP